MGEEAFKHTWFDRTHTYITSMLCQPSVWFDSFFGKKRAGEDWAGSLIQWQGYVRYDEQDSVTFRSEFDASVRLPNASKKLKLVITSESRDDQSKSLPGDDPNNLESPAAIGENEERRTTAGLKYYLSDTRKARLNVGAGLALGDPIQPFVRIRLRYTQPLNHSTLLRFTPTATLLKDDGFNRTLKLELEERVSENTLLRASQSFLREEREPGVQWGSALTFYDRLSAVTVLALEAAVTGNTQLDTRVERYRLSARLRSNFLRKWLFLELEPEYYWPRDDLGEIHLIRAITFRLELQFYS